MRFVVSFIKTERKRKTIEVLVIDVLVWLIYIYIMNDYTYCQYCNVFLTYKKDIDRYVTCPKCRADIYVGTENTYKWGKHKRTKTT